MSDIPHPDPSPDSAKLSLNLSKPPTMQTGMHPPENKLASPPASAPSPPPPNIPATSPKSMPVLSEKVSYISLPLPSKPNPLPRSPFPFGILELDDTNDETPPEPLGGLGVAVEDLGNLRPFFGSKGGEDLGRGGGVADPLRGIVDDLGTPLPKVVDGGSGGGPVRGTLADPLLPGIVPAPGALLPKGVDGLGEGVLVVPAPPFPPP